MARRPRVVLAHDWLVARRGGELVLDAVLRALGPIADVPAVLTMFDAGVPITPALDARPRLTSSLSTWPRPCRRAMLPLYPAAVAQLSRRLDRLHARSPIDLLISSHSAAIKALRPPPGVPHLCYCHAPARYIWSQTNQYGPLALPLALARPAYRRWDRATAGRVSWFLANSTHTAEQIAHAYARPAQVLFPPVRTDLFTPDPAVPRGRHWLAVGALVPYKRFDLVIAAANKARHPLTVVGDGPERGRLQRMAGPTVTFASAATDEVLRDHYRRARLLITPQQEDFGIATVEAQACGTPVVAYAHGGARDTVVDGVTGRTFERQQVGPLLEAAQRCPADPAACRAHAERFAPGRFEAGLLEAVAALLSPASAPWPRAPDR